MAFLHETAGAADRVDVVESRAVRRDKGYGALAVSGKHSVTLGTLAQDPRVSADLIAENPEQCRPSWAKRGL